MSIAAVYYSTNLSLSLMEVNTVTCYLVFFQSNIAYAGHWFLTLDETNHSYMLLQCTTCALFVLVTNKGIAQLWWLWCTWGTQCVQTCNWCFNGDRRKAQGSCSWKEMTPVTLCCFPLASSQGASGKQRSCSPLQVRHTYWAVWAITLGGWT